MPDEIDPELQARIARASGKPTPNDVLEDYDMVVRAAKADGLALFTQMCKKTGRCYYILVAMLKDGPRPLAVIPERINAGVFVENYDAWLEKHGSAEADPDFTGVRN